MNKSGLDKKKIIKTAPIGVFDSGFGGLEVFREIVKKLPENDYIYLADTARAPYGTRSQDIIYIFTEQAVDYLFRLGCPLVILACNTASSKALRRLQREYLKKHFPKGRILGVLIPASEEAVRVSKNGKIGVLATEGTVSSKAFIKEIKKLNSELKVFQQAAPLLAAMVEAGEHRSEIAKIALENYLKPLLNSEIDTLVLGCTHYGILKDKIREIIGPNIKLIVEGEVVSRKLKDYLIRHPEIEKKISQGRTMRFLTTDVGERFEELGSLFFSKPIIPEKIEL